MKKINVLYIHHYGKFGGSSRSLSEAISGLQNKVNPVFITQKGQTVDVFERYGKVITSFGMSQFDHSRYSHYRGWRWLVLLREIAYLPFTIYSLIVAKLTYRSIDLIHINEISLMIPMIIAKYMFRVPMILHVRSVFHYTPDMFRTRLLVWVINRYTSAVITIDKTVLKSLPNSIRNKHVVHNSFSYKNVDYIDIELKAKLCRLSESSFKIGFVGNLLKSKGIVELIEAAGVLNNKGLDIEFILLGSDIGESSGFKYRLLKRLNLHQSVQTEIIERMSRLNLNNRVHLVGFSKDIQQVYNKIDVLCFPSHLDAPGRPIFEAAYFSVPSIVAISNPEDDTFINNVTGIAIRENNYEDLSDAIERLYLDRDLTKRMGLQAKNLVDKNFSLQMNTEMLLSVYYNVLNHDIH